MSSAALQNTPTTLTALNSSPLVPASPSNRHYSSSHSSPTREAYHAQLQHTGASPSSSQRPSRGNYGGNGGGSSSNTSSQQHQQGHNSPMSSRAAIASPVAVAGGGSPAEYHGGSERRRNMPAAVPPRTSSNQASSSSSRRATHANERGTNSPRRAQLDANGTLDDDPAAAQSSRSRRAAHHQIAQDPPQRSSSTRESRGAGSSTTVPVRSQQAATSNPSSKGPSREASEILNSILVSQPEVDIEREQQRLELAQPHHVPGAADDEAMSPPVVSPVDNGEESRRGGRSRHDYSKREKHTKFGDYILGNTIGEGEFGKVKLGWKQEGGVQVRFGVSPFTTLFTSVSQQFPDKLTFDHLPSRSPSNSSRKISWVATLLGWPR